MTAEQFAYWLQGFVELCPHQQPSPAQWQAIKDHLSTVFNKVTPPLGKPPVGTPPVVPALPTMPPQTIPVPYTDPSWFRPNPFSDKPVITC